MPELPEVQTVVNTLVPRVCGAKIRQAKLFRSDIVTPANVDLVTRLTDRVIQTIERRGKRIVFTLEDGNRFYIHLGMSGRLTVETGDAPVVKHTHLILFLESAGGRSLSGSRKGRQECLPHQSGLSGAREVASGDGRQECPPHRMELRFRDPRRFGGVFWLGGDDPGGEMGPEPLSIRAEELAVKLKGTNRFIKTALLDQKLIAGLGNIYVDEALHAAGIYPKTRADRLKREQVERLVVSIKKVLNRALRHRGSTLRDFVDGDGLEGAFQKLHRVYDREGKACLKCKTPIKRIVLGGRSTHFCPACQGRS